MWAGPLSNWVAACDLMLGMDIETVVPGHGPLTDKAGVAAVRDYLSFVDAEATAGRVDGRDGARPRADGRVAIAQRGLPGVDPGSVDVHVDNGTLTIRAERSARGEDNVEWLASERFTGSYMRQLSLGDGIDAGAGGPAGLHAEQAPSSRAGTSRRARWVRAVSIQPGRIEFTWMLSFAQAVAMALVICTTAALLMQ